jgi:aminodeoxyfutalosine synthase
MLYGHRETLEERVDHLLRLRAAQDETGGFQAFIPLAFHPKNTELADLPPTTGVEDLKMLALARLLLDNFRHIKAYWVMIGLKLAQVSLYFGVDDVDGTIVEETITHAAGSEAGQAVARDELVRIIRDTGRTPVERDTLYRPLRRFAAAS